MPIRVGNKAEGQDFFDRVREREEIWRYLEGNHIVLSGPRRLGKTSLLQRIAEEAEDQGLLARLVDVDDRDTCADPDRRIHCISGEAACQGCCRDRTVARLVAGLAPGLRCGLPVRLLRLHRLQCPA